jgi:hypothetical protein
MQTSAAGVLNWEEGDALITSEVNYIGEVRLAGYNDGNISVFWVTQNDFLQSNLKHAYLSANGGFYSGYEEDLYSGDSQIRMLKTATSANTAVLCFNDLVVNHDQDSCEGGFMRTSQHSSSNHRGLPMMIRRLRHEFT